jgi:hypothetical protein
MATQVICPNLRCRRILSVPDDVRGRVVKCQHCQSLLKVPERGPTSAAPTPAKSR